MYNKKGGKILGKGRDGCVTNKPILCSTKSNPKDYQNIVSKVIDITNAKSRDISMFVEEFNSGEIFRNYDPNGNHFLPGLEMCYKKYHELNSEHKQDMKDCQYNFNEFESLYLNILLRKGLSFQKITTDLKSEDFLKSLMYTLIGSLNCIRDLNILLLDIKGDNLLYKEETKNNVVPVFIDFSDDFVIKTPNDLKLFLTRFSSYYNTWSLDIFILFLMTSSKNSSSIKKLNDNLKKYRNIDLFKIIDEPKIKSLRNGLFMKILTKTATKKEYQEFCEKQMLYSISISFFESYYKSKHQKDLEDKKIPNLLAFFSDELYYKRPTIDEAIDMIAKSLKDNFNVKMSKREDYIISLNKSQTPKKAPAKKYSNKDMLQLLKKTISSNNTKVSKGNNKSIIGKVSSKKPATIPSYFRSSNASYQMPSSNLDKSLLDKIDLMLLESKKKTKKSSKKISDKKNYKRNTKSIEKENTKKQLLDKITVYKKRNCDIFKSVHLMNKSDLIDGIIYFDKKQHKEILKDMSYFKLKALFKLLYNQKCKVNKNANKNTLAKFIKDNDIN